MSAQAGEPVRPGHGDHWLAALAEADPRLLEALAPPLDAPEGLRLHRRPLTRALDLVQVTHARRLLTAYPEPRATTLLEGEPRELAVWDTRVEGWLTLEHPGAGALTLFLTDLAERADRYAAHRGPMRIETGALAYDVRRARASDRPARLYPAKRADPRFLPDDYGFHAEVARVEEAGDERVLDLALQGGLVLPVTTRLAGDVEAGDPVEGFLWLTGRWPS